MIFKVVPPFTVHFYVMYTFKGFVWGYNIRIFRFRYNLLLTRVEGIKLFSSVSVLFQKKKKKNQNYKSQRIMQSVYIPPYNFLILKMNQRKQCGLVDWHCSLAVLLMILHLAKIIKPHRRVTLDQRRIQIRVLLNPFFTSVNILIKVSFNLNAFFKCFTTKAKR